MSSTKTSLLISIPSGKFFSHHHIQHSWQLDGKALFFLWRETFFLLRYHSCFWVGRAPQTGHPFFCPRRAETGQSFSWVCRRSQGRQVNFLPLPDYHFLMSTGQSPPSLKFPLCLRRSLAPFLPLRWPTAQRPKNLIPRVLRLLRARPTTASVEIVLPGEPGYEIQIQSSQCPWMPFLVGAFPGAARFSRRPLKRSLGLEPAVGGPSFPLFPCFSFACSFAFSCLPAGRAVSVLFSLCFDPRRSR